MRLLQGRPLAERIHSRSLDRARLLRARGVTPRLAAVSVGADPASSTYVQRLVGHAKSLELVVDDFALGADTTEKEVVRTLERHAADPTVHGVLLLTPLPGDLDEGHVVDHLPVEKDVEGMNPFNVGLLADGRPRFVPSTAEAVVELLRFYGVPLRGARAVVIGRSTVIGRPAAYLLLKEDATVTIAHRDTKDLDEITRASEIVVIGIGRAGFLRGDMLSPGAVVIDAGINVTPMGLVGDVEARTVAAVASALSPVPGGLGGVTTELLLRNVLTAAEQLARE